MQDPKSLICSECGGKRGKHKKTCSQYKPPKPRKQCPECGVIGGSHRKGCSKYKVTNICPECGQHVRKHLPTCSKYKGDTTCPECGGKDNKHKKTCSQYKSPEACPECGGRCGCHKKGCSQYVERFVCSECGHHGGHHYEWCSKYKVPKKCPECGGIRGNHKKGCSKYKEHICPECGAKNSHHKPECPKYKGPKPCPECGGTITHKKSCSKYDHDDNYEKIISKSIFKDNNEPTNSNIYYARNLTLERIDNKDTVRDFLNKNHNQGYARSAIAYGLYDKNHELVILMSFGTPRFNKNYQYELIRECTKIGCRVVGGTSKIWNKFITDNKVVSCVCYSYPQNHEYTNHYVDYCGFVNIEKSKPKEKVYFTGVYNGEEKRIDKSILERLGVDRILGGDFGKTRTNEQILLDLGFERKTEDGYAPQVDSYFPFGVVYRIEDLDDGTFYIGETTDEVKWNDGYLGSGTKWAQHLREFPPIDEEIEANKNGHHYKRTILKSGFKSPKDLYNAEIKEIRKYAINNGTKIDETTGCMNAKLTRQGELVACPECGGSNNHHKKGCSQYKEIVCPECGTKSFGHKKWCSHYKNNTPDCPECGGKRGSHRKGCSHYKGKAPCPECGSIGSSHKKTCSHYHPKTILKHKESDGTNSKHELTVKGVCPECGGKNGWHKETCSKYTERPQRTPCPECGSIGPQHKKICSHYRAAICPECGGKGGHHLSTCSKSKGTCPECGYSLSSNHHAPTCSHYEPPKICPECGGKGGCHRNGCSKRKIRKPCPECGSIGPRHKKGCSLDKKNK